MIALLLSTMAALVGADALRRRIRPREDATGLVLLLLFLSAIQSVVILAAGLIGLLSATPLTLLATGALLAFWATGEFRRIRPWSLPRPSSPSEWALAALLGAGLLWLAAKVFLLSPYWGDALTYHLPKIAAWIQAGRFVFPVGLELRQWFPAGFELIEIWWCVFLHGDLLIEIAGLQMLALALASLHVIARLHGARPGAAVVFYAFLPIVILHVTACGNDLAAAAMILAAYALIGERLPRAVQALPLLLGAGIKPTVIFGAAGALLYALRAGPPARMARSWTAALLALGLILGGFWYGRNLVLQGHPLYPVYGTGGGNDLRANLAENLDTLRRTLDDFPDRVLDRRVPTSLASGATAWGWLVLALGFPAALWALRQDPEFRRLALCFLTGGFATVALSPLSDLNLRFALWFPALFTVAVAKIPARGVLAAGASACLLNFVSTVWPADELPASGLRPPDSLPRKATVACVCDDDVPAYPLYGSDFGRIVVYPRSMEELRASGARYVQLWKHDPWTRPIGSWTRVGRRLYEVP